MKKEEIKEMAKNGAKYSGHKERIESSEGKRKGKMLGQAKKNALSKMCM